MKSVAAVLLVFVAMPALAIWPFDDATDRYQDAAEDLWDCNVLWVRSGLYELALGEVVKREKEERAQGIDRKLTMDDIRDETDKARHDFCDDEIEEFKQARLECLEETSPVQCEAACERGGTCNPYFFLP